MPKHPTVQEKLPTSIDDWFEKPSFDRLIEEVYDPIRRVKVPVLPLPGTAPDFDLPNFYQALQTYIIRRQSKVQQANAKLERKFRRLADQWLKETEHVSSIKKACMHPSYQHIIGMGRDALPLLLQELQQNPDHWFWALYAIAEEDPAQSEDTFDGAVRAWLNWGKEQGHL